MRRVLVARAMRSLIPRVLHTATVPGVRARGPSRCRPKRRVEVFIPPPSIATAGWLLLGPVGSNQASAPALERRPDPSE